MKSVRETIKARMKQYELNAYDVAQLVKGEMSPQTVYNFVKGRSEMNTKSLASILEALALAITPISAIRDTKLDTASLKRAVSKRKHARANVRKSG